MELAAAVFTWVLALVPLVFFGGIFESKWRKRWLALAIYVAVYLPFSLLGSYGTANQGGMDWRDWWCPRGLAEQYQRVRISSNGRISRSRSKVRFTYLGALYWPLMILDNLVWHPTRETDLSK